MKKILIGLLAMSSLSAFASDDFPECLSKIRAVTKTLASAELKLPMDKLESYIFRSSQDTQQGFYVSVFSPIENVDGIMRYNVDTVDIGDKKCVIESVTYIRD